MNKISLCNIKCSMFYREVSRLSGVVILIMCIAVAVIVLVVKRVTALNDNAKNAFIIVPCDSKTKNLERIVKSYYWEEVFEKENMSREILIVIMEKNSNDLIAKRLSEEYSIVTIVDICDLESYLKNAKNVSEKV